MASPFLREMRIPLYLLALLLAALTINAFRGFTVARQHSQSLQPTREVAILELENPAITVRAGSSRYAIGRLPTAGRARVALHQLLPERSLVRWIQPEGDGGDWLVIPLAGLDNGVYALSWAAEGEVAGPVELAGPEDERGWIGRFEINRE